MHIQKKDKGEKEVARGEGNRKAIRGWIEG